MDKVTVDARKLQMLNDRINQTIDACNQVRATIHAGGLGLSHTPIGFPQQLPAYGQLGLQHAGVGNIGYGIGGLPVGYGQAYGQVPFGFGVGTQLGMAQPWALQTLPQVGFFHTTLRSPVVDLVQGVFDPTQRQVELARAAEANRAWEIACQQLGQVGQQVGQLGQQLGGYSQSF